MSDETSTERDMSSDLYKERSTIKKTPDYVTRARRSPAGWGVDMSTCPPPTPDVHPPADGPEPIGAIAERVLDDLAERRAAAMSRLTRAHRRPS